MPLTIKGSSLTFQRNPANGKMRPVWSGGNFAFDDGMAEVVFSLLFEDESWSTAGRRKGPSLLSVRFDDDDATDRVREYAAQRLQLAIDDGRLRSVTPTCRRIKRGSLVLGVEYTTKGGRQDMVAIPLPIGQVST